ncbi:MAG TPA: DUF3592 domain-containing protein [Tepidisphaeraceae bacterium]|jgi:hypothetical protein
MPSTVQIPADLQAAPPRRVAWGHREGWWQMYGVWFGLATSAMLGILVFAAVASEPLLLALTPPLQATVKAVTMSRANTRSRWSRRTVTYQVYYSYRPRGWPAVLDPVENCDSISQGEYHALHDKASVMIHAGPLGLTTLHRTLWGYIAARWLWWCMILVWNGLTFILLRQTWLRRHRARRLLRNGRPAVGRITGRGTDRNAWAPNAHVVKYEFSVGDAASPPHRASTPVGVRDYERARVGQHVIVVYDPHDLDQSLVYDFCRYV